MTEREKLNRSFVWADRTVRVLQSVVALLLIALLCYGAWVTYEGQSEKLLTLLPATAAALAAILVAAVATRLLCHNLIVRNEDETKLVVRVSHHAMMMIDDLHSRISYLKTAVPSGKCPLSAIILNVDTISRRYETFYAREIYECVPGPIITRIACLSGSIFGISAFLSAIASRLGNEQHAIIPGLTSLNDSGFMSQIDSLLVALDELRIDFENLRKTVS